MHDVGGGQWWRAGSHACHPASSCYCSAEPLLADPALFSARRAQQPFGHLDGVQLLLEYCDLLDLQTRKVLELVPVDRLVLHESQSEALAELMADRTAKVWHERDEVWERSYSTAVVEVLAVQATSINDNKPQPYALGDDGAKMVMIQFTEAELRKQVFLLKSARKWQEEEEEGGDRDDQQQQRQMKRARQQQRAKKGLVQSNLRSVLQGVVHKEIGSIVAEEVWRRIVYHGCLAVWEQVVHAARPALRNADEGAGVLGEVRRMFDKR